MGTPVILMACHKFVVRIFSFVATSTDNMVEITRSIWYDGGVDNNRSNKEVIV